MRVIGLDPGILGAFAVLEVESFSTAPGSVNSKRNVRLITVQDFPLYKEIKNKLKETTRNRIELTKLGTLLKVNLEGVRIALIEDVGKMPTASDPLAAFAFGFATGAVSALVVANHVPLERIRPDVWKASFGLTSDKKKSIELAKRLVPESKEFLTKMKDDGKAEAILLAYYASQNIRFK